MRQAIFLIGPRACGKTTAGTLLAEKLGMEFVDTDRHLTGRSGMTVAAIVEREGWDGFRRREAETLKEVGVPGTVVATGGGMPLSAENRRFMRETGIVVYLRAACETLAERLSANPDASQRPSLTGKSLVEEIAEVLREREELYLEASHHIVRAEQPLHAVVDDLLALEPVVGDH